MEKINQKVIDIVEKSSFKSQDIFVYLLSLFFNYEPSYIPEKVKEETNRLGIINRDYLKGTVQWIVPLFNITPEIDTAWDWVHNDYRKLFSDVKAIAGGNKKSCTMKMKKFFSEHPDVRKQDVIDAAKLYIEEFANGKNNPVYMQRADYFISKTQNGVGGKAVESRLEMYVEIIMSKTEKAPTTSRHMRGLIK